MELFCQWVEKRDNSQNIEVLATDTWNSILQHFLAEIDKKDPMHYDLSSLKTMISSIDRYFCESNYEYSLLNSRLFKRSRDVLMVTARLIHG